MTDDAKKKDIKANLDRLAFPVYLVAYGPARDHRTTYRAEHHGVFGSTLVYTADEGIRFIESLNYPGWIDEMDLIAISIDPTEHILQETVL